MYPDLSVTSTLTNNVRIIQQGEIIGRLLGFSFIAEAIVKESGC